MKQKKGIQIFGLAEIGIGTITFTMTVMSLLDRTSTKPLNILIFVLASSLISASLGIGILRRMTYARKLLIFFAGWIILSKILIFFNILSLNGSLETHVPTDIKNIISILYHMAIILYFHRSRVKEVFEPTL